MITLHPWRAGRGWLVLIGGSTSWPPTEPIDRETIARMDQRKPIAFLPAAGCPPGYVQSFLEAYTRLGAPDGYEVPVRDIAAARDPKYAELLQRTGLIYIGGGDTRDLLASMTGTPALSAMASAYERGAVIVGNSAGAIGLATFGVSMDPQIGVLEGWGWVPRTLVSVHHTPEREESFARALRDHPDTIGIALPENTAIAVGPKGENEQWGAPGIVITPGPHYVS